MKIKALSLLIAICMVVSLFPAAAAEDSPNAPAPETGAQEHTHETEPVLPQEEEVPAAEAEPDAAPVLPLGIEEYPMLTYGTEMTLSDVGSEYTYITFTPEKDGSYRFYSVGYDDTVAQLYDAQMNQLDYSDDCYTESHNHEYGGNFCLNADLEGGVTYILGVRFYSGGNRDMTIGVTCSHSYVTEYDPESNSLTMTCSICGHAYTIQCVELGVDGEVTAAVSSEEAVYLIIRPETTDEYRIHAQSAFFVGLEILDDQMSLLESAGYRCTARNHGHHGNGHFCVSAQLKAGETYVVRAYMTYGDAGDVTFDFGISHEYIPTAYRTDDGTCIITYACACCDDSYEWECPTLTYGDEVTIQASWRDGKEYVAFTPETTGSYGIYSLCERETWGYLYGPDLEPVSSINVCRDDRHNHPTDENFCLTAQLEGGVTYLLGVEAYGGEYKVTLGVGCGHTFDSQVIREATCAEPGITRYTCSICDYSYDEEVTVEHSYISTITKEATCAEPGIRTYTCTMCGDSYDKEIRVSHRYVSEIIDKGTCAEPGTIVHTCDVCGHTETEEYRIHHNYVCEVIKEVTCNENGLERYTCTGCGDSYDEERWRSHDYQRESIPGTCTQEGYDVYTCTRCGYSYTDEESGWYEHDYEDVVATEPTCTEPGQMEERCTLCGDANYIYEIDPLGHDYNDELICTRCGEAAATAGAWGQLSWTYADGVLTITGEGEMPELEFIEAWDDFWIDNTPWKDIPVREAVIGEGITNVTAALFENREELQKVTLPSTLTDIGSVAFHNCSALTAVDLPEGLTSIGYDAFYGCALTEIVLPESLTEVDRRAFGCCDLREVHIPAGLLDPYSDRGYYQPCDWFDGNWNLKYISVDANNPRLCADDQGVLYSKDMSELLLMPCGFEGTYVLPASVTALNDSFYNCAKLDTIEVEAGNSAYFSQNGMLYCNGIYTDYWDENDNTIYVHHENVLIACPPARDVGDYTIDAQTGGLDQYAFRNCTKLTGLTIPKTCTININHYHNAGFRDIVSGCSALAAVRFEEGHPECFNDENGFVYNAKDRGVSLLNEFEAGTILEYVPAVGIGAYLEIPEGVEAVDAYLESPELRAIRFPSTLRGFGNRVLTDCTLDWMLFTGNEPIDVSMEDTDWANGVTAKVYYPNWLESWDSFSLDVMNCNLTCIPYEQGQEPVWGEEKPENPFTDVPEGSFYAAPVAWAVEKGITTGASENSFNPNGECLRAQVVTFLWRAEGCPEPKSLNNPFVDVKASDFYFKAVLWAVENGITNGSDATHFNPFGVCNRAQVVTFLHRAKGSPAPASLDLPFTDVPAGSFYAAPVAWAVENGITNGVDATHFGPNTACNRAQVVTFLYRAYTAS